MKRCLHFMKLAALAATVAWGLQHALLGPSGYLALRQQQRQYAQQVARVHTLEAQNRTLNQAVHALQSDPNAIEDIARKQLHLTRPGEVIYTYPTAPAPSSAHAAAVH
ncbi:MAG: FtsB family cell division protein [Terriglobales bacterium]